MVNLKVIQDKRKRLFFKKKESNVIILKFLLRNKNLPLQKTLKFIYLNQSRLSFTKLKNNCVLTGRSHSINRQTKLSRIKFREFGLSGLILGIKKITW